jgi:hypothetical protein
MDVFHPDPAGAYYLDVWAAGPNDVFVSAAAGKVLRYKDSNWSQYQTGTALPLLGIWGSSADNVFAVGEGGEIQHFDGSSWSPMYSGVLHSLQSVWGSGPDTVYAVGDRKTMLQYDGAAWADFGLESIWTDNVTFYDVSGSPDGGLWAVGTDWSSGDGAWLRRRPVGTEYWNFIGVPLSCVWGPSADTTLIGAQNGDVYHFTASGFIRRTVSAGNEIQALWGSSQEDVWAGHNEYAGQITGLLHRWDGSNWSDVPDVALDTGVKAMDGVAADEVYAIGYGALLTRWDGTQWEMLNNERITAEDLTAIWGSSADNFWTFAQGGQVFHYDGSGWSDTTVAGVADRMVDAWGSGPNDVYAVGGSGTVLHFDGNSWSVVDHGLTTAYLLSIWGTASDDIWIGGLAGQMISAGGRWGVFDTWPGEYGPAQALWGSAPNDYYAVVYNGVMHYDGSTWSVAPFGGRQVVDVHGVSGTEVYFLVMGSGVGPRAASEQPAPRKVGRTPVGSTLMRYDGANLVEVATDIPADLSEVFALGSDNVFMAGFQYNQPAIAHYNGTGVSVKTADVGSGCYSLWATGSNTAFATGTLGAVFRATAR